MKKYVDILISDIEQAKERIPEPFVELNYINSPFGTLPLEEDLKIAKRASLEELTEISKASLPPNEKISKAQISRILNSLKSLLTAFNCHVVFHIDVPEPLQYKVIREMFDQEMPVLVSNFHFFQFCHQNTIPGDCTLGETYCNCKYIHQVLEKFEIDEPWDSKKEAEFWENFEWRKRKVRRNEFPF